MRIYLKTKAMPFMVTSRARVFIGTDRPTKLKLKNISIIYFPWFKCCLTFSPFPPFSLNSPSMPGRPASSC